MSQKSSGNESGKGSCCGSDAGAGNSSKGALRTYRVALAGNPNSGKTTLFNRLTGSHQHVGNWSGVTIEKKSGDCLIPEMNARLAITDLPGIYSLVPASAEEVIARDFLFTEKPDLVINIVDATNLERNLFLTLQLIRNHVPVLVALNMMDEAAKNGDDINVSVLSDKLGVPVVPISAIKGGGFSHMVLRLFGKHPDDGGLGNLLRAAVKAASAGGGCAHPSDGTPGCPDCPAARPEDSSADASETDDTEALYAEISQITAACFRAGVNKGLQRSYRIDKLLTHKLLGIPIFIVLMLLIFQMSFGSFSSYLSDLIDVFLNETLAGALEAWFAGAGTPEWMGSLVIGGIIAGVGAVLSFLPQIAILFLFLTLMEDTGYMARAAFIMDRLFRKIGLSGKSFISMILGFGCSVPAVMAARTIADENDRKATIIVTPFMSCSARLPIYALFVGIFFSAHEGLIMTSIYILGILVAIFSALLLKKTVLKSEEAPFIMELPPYRMPTLTSVVIHVWDKVRGFVIRAGTILFALSIVIWFLQSFDMSLQMVADNSDSIFGTIGHVIEPLFAPVGFGDWRAAVAVLTGFIAKESVVSTIEILYTAEEFASFFTPLTAYAFMAFTLLYMPCVAAVVAIRRELGSTKWALFAVGYQTIIAYAVAFLIFQAGRLLGFA